MQVTAHVIVPVLKTAGLAGHQPANEGGHESDTDPARKLEEACGLARAIDLDIRRAEIIPVAAPKSATLFRGGKIDELKARLAAGKIDLLIIDHPLTPIQQRNLERALNVKILDRTGLILEIFGDRAQTREGRLQVDLAHLSYQKSRLVRSWTHLERQRGGVGFMGGPGERQIESDRRQIQDKINALRHQLEQVKRTRQLHRDSRKRVPYPVIALVGYTNAGKSTLFNALTGASVLAKDALFATLDPTMREIRTSLGEKCILSDTVGFISDLPTQLIAAFRATLEEVASADLILHVRDIASPQTEAQKADVLTVLAQLGISAQQTADIATATDQPFHPAAANDTASTPAPETEIPIIEVWNKWDLLPADEQDRLVNLANRQQPRPVPVSALNRTGFDELAEAIMTTVSQGAVHMRLDCAPADGPLIHWLHENAQILNKRYDDDGHARIDLKFPRKRLAQFQAQIKRSEARITKMS